MRKFSIILFCVLLANAVFAQKGKVNSATYALSEGKANEAKQFIDKAIIVTGKQIGRAHV